MTKESARRVPVEKAATPTEIAAEIEALSPADVRKLQRIAKVRIWRIGPHAAADRTAEDLFQIAIADLLDDTRRWDKSKIGFFRFLAEAMKSISSNWAKTHDDEHPTVLQSDLQQKEKEGKGFNPYDQAPVTRPNPEQALRDTETLQQIDELFKDDEEAQQVITAWREGFDPAGVRELWGLSQNAYNTIVRRIRRNLEAAGVTADRERGTSNVQ